MEDVGGVSEAPSFEVKVNSPTKTDVTGKVLWEPCIRLASILAIQKITVVTGIIEIYSPQKKTVFCRRYIFKWFVFHRHISLQRCKCFLFQWFRLTTPRICGNGGCLLSSQKITEIPGVFLQKWRSEFFVAVVFWWWPEVFFWYVHVFLANKLLLFHLMFWPRFSWCRCWSHVGYQYQVACSTVEPCWFSGVVQNFWWWRSGEDDREGRNGCTDAWLLVKICERKTIEIVEKMSQNSKKTGGLNDSMT